MKTRLGFVSNSSSCSFFIDADKFRIREIERVLEKAVELHNDMEDEKLRLLDILEIWEVKSENICGHLRQFSHTDKLIEIISKQPKWIEIAGTYDNSIPTWMMALIGNKWNAIHQHWG